MYSFQHDLVWVQRYSAIGKKRGKIERENKEAQIHQVLKTSLSQA